MINVTQFVKPDSLPSALEELNREGSIALAGGTSLSLSKSKKYTKVVNLSNLTELKKIETKNNRLEIGAMVSMTQLAEVEDSPFPILRKTASSIYSTAIRNMTTVGGEIAKGVYWVDLPVTLLALDTQVLLQNSSSSRTVALSEIYNSHPSKFINSNELITKIFIPLQKSTSSFHKFTKTQVDYVLASAAGKAVKDGNIIKQINLSIGGVTPLPCLLPQVSSQLVGKKITDEIIEEVSTECCKEIKFKPDFRASTEYQKSLIKVMISRVLQDLQS
ncbi:MAG: FAD binding domain-containing protein [Deltaproteobacteria bacterium]|jgi:xanthine dehydrogenase small subunit|nr:FAD binding domain-containing protein [Deltaproteobacteria bacterium]